MAMTFVYDNEGPIRRVICTWTSDGSGNAAGTMTQRIGGFLLKGQTNPDGSAAPSDNYNIVITDPNALNVLAFSHDDLLARDTANTEEVYFAMTLSATDLAAYPAVNDLLTVTVSGAGAAGSGVLTLYYLKPW